MRIVQKVINDYVQQQGYKTSETAICYTCLQLILLSREVERQVWEIRSLAKADVEHSCTKATKKSFQKSDLISVSLIYVI